VLGSALGWGGTGNVEVGKGGGLFGAEPGVTLDQAVNGLLMNFQLYRKDAAEQPETNIGGVV
jgi:hypothetical protein